MQKTSQPKNAPDLHHGSSNRNSTTSSGLPCPHGCKGSAWRMYGLVSHLVEKHGYTAKQAWDKVRQ